MMKKYPFFILIVFFMTICVLSWSLPTTVSSDSFALGKPYQITLNGLDQTILVHSNNESNPILLVLHGGPGYAMLPLMHAINPQLEDEFKNASQGFLDFEVPVYFFMGQHDYDTPVNLFEEYYTSITSTKAYIRFEDSAHFPFYEEPAKFRAELIKVKRDTY